jgi:hypothetical protein
MAASFVWTALCEWHPSKYAEAEFVRIQPTGHAPKSHDFGYIAVDL